jgi:hypothetical protein
LPGYFRAEITGGPDGKNVPKDDRDIRKYLV